MTQVRGEDIIKDGLTGVMLSRLKFLALFHLLIGKEELPVLYDGFNDDGNRISLEVK